MCVAAETHFPVGRLHGTRETRQVEEGQKNAEKREKRATVRWDGTHVAEEVRVLAVGRVGDLGLLSSGSRLVLSDLWCGWSVRVDGSVLGGDVSRGRGDSGGLGGGGGGGAHGREEAR